MKNMQQSSRDIMNSRIKPISLAGVYWLEGVMLSAYEIDKLYRKEFVKDLKEIDGSKVLDIHVKRLIMKWSKKNDGSKKVKSNQRI